MKHLEKIVSSVLIYMAIYLPFVVILQAVSGGDFTAAYSAGGAMSIVELALTAIIQIRKQKVDKKSTERSIKDEQNQLETETFEP